MKISLPKPINDVQAEFADLCSKGGGAGGGPARTKVQTTLRKGGQRLNELAEREIAGELARFPNVSPWKVCFTMGLCWGHLAQLSDGFFDSALDYLESGSGASLHQAMAYHNERGPEVIERSLISGGQLLGKINLPDSLPDSLQSIRRVQDRWLGRILAKDRPAYIGSWNGTAMFMVALFAQPSLGDQMLEASVMLPPGGPIYAALSLLHRLKVLGKAPEGNELDDESFEPGAIYANTGLMADLRRGRDDWDLLDVHSGLYMLGTRDPASASYFQ